MFASSSGSRAQRRGIVLVVVLGMLGLMALIGVTFATFAGQSLIAGRNFGQGVGRPQAEALMDYALAQLINDTNNPVSAIRGHSLLRDMYGNDSVFRGANPTTNPAGETGGVLTSVYNQSTGQYVVPQLTALVPRTQSNNGPSSATPFYNQIQFQTNIPTTGQYYGLDFTRWILKIPGAATANNATYTVNGVVTADTSNNTLPQNGYAAQTFEILEDYAPVGGVHYFTLSNNLTNPTVDLRNTNANPPAVPSDWATFLYFDPNFMNPNVGVSPNMPGQTAYTFTKAAVSPAREWLSNTAFILDGRNMRAFNGPGLTSLVQRTDNVNNILDTYPFNSAAYANFRVQNLVTSANNANYKTSYPLLDPDAVGMDEDYDACDLENWFLAIQSADGQVVVPSFHRPGILSANDWKTNGYGAAKILRPRQIDNSPFFPPDPSVTNSNGTLTYDLDNDGDGITDSVWLDLGYPVQRDPGGKLYKPLFAFMILGTNGRLPLNTVGNLQARANADQTNNGAAANAAGTLPVSTTGQVPYPGTTGDANNQFYKSATINGVFGLSGQSTFVSSQTYLDAPLWDHTSHAGYSVNEVNPKFALQNAPSNAYNSASSVAANNNAAIAANVNGNNYSQVDNAGVSVALTQMRNILAGTIPTDLPYPYSGKYPIPAGASANGDVNVVMVNGHYMVLPNNMADPLDILPANSTFVPRNLPALAGRWGETAGILANSALPVPGSGAFGGPIIYPGLIYNNPVRAGRSIYTLGTNDVFDDDFEAIDPVLVQYATTPLYFREPSLAPLSTNTTNTVPITRALPEFADTFDTIGQRAVASERIRQFVTPIDPAATGRMVDFMKRPNNDNDFGNGYDNRGRASYFRYFRPAGMPQDIRYPYGGPNSTWVGYPYFPTQFTSGGTHRFLMPQLFPAGSTFAAYPTGNPAIRAGASDVHNNPYHGYQSMLTPEIGGTTNLTQQQIAPMAPMPYDWDNSTTTTTTGTQTSAAPAGYAYFPNGNASYSGPSTPPGPPLAASFVNNFAPTINPTTSVLGTAINTNNGPNFGQSGNPLATTLPPASMFPIGYGGYMAATDSTPPNPFAQVVNGYLGSTVVTLNGNVLFTGGALNKDEADEMNLYLTNQYDQPYGPSDLEWLYRLQDVDGSTLNSRLSKLAPVSFTNPADGLTRRRLFSTDSWEPTGWVYANDNPSPYAGAAYGASTDHIFTFNSRFTPYASPSLEIMNQIDGDPNNPNLRVAFPLDANSNPLYGGLPTYAGILANPITTEYLPNPTLPTLSPFAASFTQPQLTSFSELYPNSSYAKQGQNNNDIPLPTQVDKNNKNLFDAPQIRLVTQSGGVVTNYGNNSMAQVQTPALAHRDRRINLNYPLPISNDPGEPVRQKWCRETYTLLKAILPPASVDTPEELASLSQFVVNIIDFRDPDCTTTRFVNTDLVPTDVLTRTASPAMPTTISATLPAGSFGYDTSWNVSPSGVRFANSSDTSFLTFPYDPSLYNPDVVPHFLVQHGMEYNPIAINEAMAFQYQYVRSTGSGATASTVMDVARGLILELTNTLTEEQNNSTSINPTLATNNASAINLAGWDIVLAPDNFGWGRPDSITGDVNPVALPPVIVTTTGGVTTGAYSPFRTQPMLGTGATAVKNPFLDVKQFQFTTGTIKAIYGTTPSTSLVGLYAYPNSNPTASSTPPMLGTTSVENNPAILQGGSSISVQLPVYMIPTAPVVGSGQGLFYWAYLRRPANPFDTTNLGTDNPSAAAPPAGPQFNREMVVVDAIRVPFIDGGGGPPGGGMIPYTPVTGGTAGTTAGMATPNPSTFSEMWSARRLQPYRGGQLLRADSNAGPIGSPFGATTDQNGNNVAANGVTTICPPSPANAYGFSEQTSPYISNAASYGYVRVGSTITQISGKFRESIGLLGTGGDNPRDTQWAHLPFNDRDFTSVAELLLVPGCPPGLFTKQFIEEPYPGNAATETVATAITVLSGASTSVTANTSVQYGVTTTVPVNNTYQYATGSDNRDLVPTTMPTPAGIKAPVVYPLNTASTPPYMTSNPNNYTASTTGNVTTVTTTTNPVGGRANFNAISLPNTTVTGGTLQYTANPVSPTFPYLPDNFYYTATSVAPPSTGYPGYYTNLTTEIGGWTGAGWHKMMEFFEVPSSANGAIGTADGGFNFDWARQDVKPGLLNLNLIIDEEVFAGLFDDPRLNERLAAYTTTGSAYIPFVVTQVDNNNGGTATSFYPMSSLVSTNYLNSPLDTTWYPNNTPGNVSLQFGRGYSVRDSDSQNFNSTTVTTFYPYQQLHGLKAAFSDFLKLRHGGSGFLFAHGAAASGAGNLSFNNVTSSIWSSGQAVAADRPYRSLSYPDINYTIMRPASLPPSAATPTTAPAQTNVPFPSFSTLFTYQVDSVGTGSFVQLNPSLAPRNLVTGNPAMPAPQQYVGDPGVKNPYLSVQYANPTAPTSTPTTPEPSYFNAGPPYPVLQFNSTDKNVPSAPFPPPIPPTPTRRLVQVPDIDTSAAQGIFYDSATPPNIYQFTASGFPSSNASVLGSQDGTGVAGGYTVNQPVRSPSLYYGNAYPATLVAASRSTFLADNNTPQPSTSYVPTPINQNNSPVILAGANNYLGAGRQSTGTVSVGGTNYATALPQTNDYRQHPLYRTEMLQKMMNLTTVRTHQFAVWITVGFFEVVKPGTPELGIPDVLGQELGAAAGRAVRYRSFFTLDRTKATGFNPYYPGDFRNVVTYRRRIE